MMEHIHPQWQPFIRIALQTMDKAYLQELKTATTWLPTNKYLFAAFSQPLSNVKYILMGESPYPRAQSANGYAFWDNAVDSLWSAKGFSKEVNRATSLRNLMKMLLFARGDLSADFSQQAIAALRHTDYVQSGRQLFESFIQKGFLLLNASLVYSEGKVDFHAAKWRPFIDSLLSQLAEQHASLELLLFGRIAKQIKTIHSFKLLVAEHPYNISFITNSDVVNFFRPLDILCLTNPRQPQNLG